MRAKSTSWVAMLALALGCWMASTGDAVEWGLQPGTPEVQSVGPLAFGPDGVLLVGDTKAAALLAISTNEPAGDSEDLSYEVNDLHAKIADLVGVSPNEVELHDVAVSPHSGSIYLSVSHGSEGQLTPALLRIAADGKLRTFSLENVAHARVELPNPPEDKLVGEGRRRRNRRGESITDIAFADGKVLVSGLTNGDSPSAVREIPFPFFTADAGTVVEIYHGAHGRYEDDAVVRTFVPFMIDGEPNLLAGFQCTPLVKFPLDGLKPGTKLRGTTLAELGNRNRPLDMVVYEKDGSRYLLMANSARGVMKISTEDIERPEGITERVGGSGTAGQTYETIDELAGVVQLDQLNEQHAVVVIESDGGTYDLRTVPLP